MNDHFYFLHLRDALTKGIEHFARGMPSRETYINANRHLFLGTQLVGSFAYMESRLPKGWIQSFGHAQTRELYCLRFIRNAFVHENSNLSELKPPWLGKIIDESKGMPANIVNYVETFASDLKGGAIKDDNGYPYPAYLAVNMESLYCSLGQTG